jgi:pilus assembly protein Flp/PilA
MIALFAWLQSAPKRDEDGVTALEYGLLAALIAVVLIAGATLLGNNLNTLFNGIAALITF